MDDGRHPAQAGVANLVFLKQALKCASAIPVAQLGTANVEWDAVKPADIVRAGHELKRGGRIDEAPDCPGGRDTVDVDSLARDEVHGSR